MLLPVAAHLFTAVCVSAQDIVFPSVLNLERSQHPLGQDDGIDIGSGSEFNGLTTFAKLPYANCFTELDMEAYDIAILGSPFDTVSHAQITDAVCEPAKFLRCCPSCEQARRLQ